MNHLELMTGEITGELNFFSHTIDGCPPWVDYAKPTLDWVASNYVRTPARVIIRDLLGRENNVDLDTNGFELLTYDGHTHDEFDDESEAQRAYYADIVALLKKRLTAYRVIVFSHIFRFRGPTRTIDQCDMTHMNPVLYPHVDSDPCAARLKVQQILGEEEAKRVMKNRFQIINVWRPLGPNPITSMPLTICDYRSLDLDKDIHVSEAYGSQVTAGTYIISRNAKDAQRWCYLSQMRSDKMFLFKIFDSNPDVAQFGAHTAFINKHVPPTNAEQKSIELRCLVVYDQ